MEDQFQDVLNSIDAKRGRSRLEPYGEFVDELRRQGFTCREIAALLLEKFQSFRLRRARSTISCGPEREGRGMPPAKFLVT
jgi:hypothetical protein